MMIKLFTLTVALLLTFNSLRAQSLLDDVTQNLVTHIEGGEDNDVFYDIVVDDFGNSYAFGISNSITGDFASNHGGRDIWIVKYDATGVKEWSRLYGGSNLEDAGNIEVLPSGNLIISAGTRSSNGDVPAINGTQNAWLFEIDPIGDIVWSKTYGEELRDSFWEMVVGEDGTIWCAGVFTSATLMGMSNQGEMDIFLAGFDSQGNLLKSWSFGGSGWDNPIDLEWSNGNLVLFGETTSQDGDLANANTSGGDNDFFLVYDTAVGVTSRYFVDYSTEHTSIAFMPLAQDTGYHQLVVGSLYWDNWPSAGWGEDSYVMTWLQRSAFAINRLDLGYLHDITKFSAGQDFEGYLCAGYRRLYGDPTVTTPGFSDGFVVLLDSTGGVLDTLSIGTEETDFLYAADENNLMVALSGKTYSGEGSERKEDGYVVLAGATITSTSESHITEELAVWPNPFSDKVEVAGAWDDLKLYAIDGQLVHEASGANELSVSHLPQGIYIVEVTKGSQVLTQRLIKK